MTIDKSNTNANNHQNFDLVISGGGLAGSLMALSLANLVKPNGQVFSIAIIEANPVLDDISLTFDDRVLALSHGTAQYLKKVGAWELLSTTAEAIKKIHISDRGYYGKARLDAKDYQVSALGYVVEMSLIGQSLLSTLAKHKQIKWFSPDKVKNIDWQAERVNVELASGHQLSTPLLLGCDGAQSVCRKLAKIYSEKSDYGQCALIANVSTANAHNNLAFERFTETGPIAMLPLSKGRCSLVWTLTPEMALQMKVLDDDGFKKQLELSFGSWLGAITHVGKRDIYPLSLVQASEQVYHRMALIGNASHTIHPIAGQGFNLGVRDVAKMADLIKNAIENANDIGQFSSLERYALERKTDHQQVISLTDSLVTLFSNDLMPLVIGRNIGLKVLNYIPAFKKALVKKTMGY